jgi:hypothetical protein
MFSLSKRSATLSGKAKIDGKQKREGTTQGTDLTVLTFEFEELKIDAAELGALMREPHAFDALYNSGANPIEPFLRGLKSLELAESIPDAYVRVDVGLSGYTRFDFKACKLSKIRLELRQGGETALSCRVQVAPDMNAKLATLLEFLGHSVQAELRGEAPGAQADLPLNTHGAKGAPRKEPKRRGTTPPPKNGDTDDPHHIGTAAEERAKAHKREQGIAQALAADRAKH